MAEPLVRLAHPADADGVLALWTNARSPHAVTPDSRDALDGLVADGSLLVAEAGHEIVGALIAAWDGWRGNMYRLAVHPNRRREKIALALIRSGEQRLQDRGCVRVTALVPHEDEAPRALWKAAGYGHDRQIQRFVKNL